MDMTITLGNLVQIGVVVVGIFMAYTKLKERLIAIETQLGPVWADFIERRREQRRSEDRD